MGGIYWAPSYFPGRFFPPRYFPGVNEASAPTGTPDPDRTVFRLDPAVPDPARTVFVLQ